MDSEWEFFEWVLPTSESRVFLEKLTVTQLVKEFFAFYGTRRFYKMSTIAPYPELDKLSPHTHALFKIHFNIILQPTPSSYR